MTARKFTGELCSCTHFSLAEILVPAGTTGAGAIARLTSTMISARLKRVQEHSSPVKMIEYSTNQGPEAEEVGGSSDELHCAARRAAAATAASAPPSRARGTL